MKEGGCRVQGREEREVSPHQAREWQMAEAEFQSRGMRCDAMGCDGREEVRGKRRVVVVVVNGMCSNCRGSGKVVRKMFCFERFGVWVAAENGSLTVAPTGPVTPALSVWRCLPSSELW